MAPCAFWSRIGPLESAPRLKTRSRELSAVSQPAFDQGNVRVCSLRRQSNIAVGYGRNETIAATRDGFNESGTVRGVTQCIAQLLDCGVQPFIEFHKRVGGPQPLL